MDVTRFKFSTPCTFTKWKEQCSWVLDKFGPIGERWDYEHSRFHFVSENDRLLFQLTWG